MSVRRALDILGPRWNLLIINALMDGPIRLSNLSRFVGPSPEILRVRLTSLTDAGLVRRARYREAPPRVMYELTDLGRETFAILESLQDFGEKLGARSAMGRDA